MSRSRSATERIDGPSLSSPTPAPPPGRPPAARAVVIGARGFGGFVMQIGGALRLAVVALDASPQRLDPGAPLRATHRILTRDASGAQHDVRELRDEVSAIARAAGLGPRDRPIVECAGVPAPHQIAFRLLGRVEVMVQAGFRGETTSLRRSNLRAFDATIPGTWGRPPEADSPVLDPIAPVGPPRSLPGVPAPRRG